LEQRFTAHTPLLIATTAFRLGRRPRISPYCRQRNFYKLSWYCYNKNSFSHSDETLVTDVYQTEMLIH